MEEFLSILQGLVLEAPGPLVIGLGLAGVVLMMSAVNRRHKRLAVTAGLVWAAAVGVAVASVMVTTDREEVSAATAMLLRATASPVDMAGIRDKLSPEARLLGPDGDVWLRIDELLPQMESSLKRWPVHEQHVRDSRVKMIDGKARVELHLSTRTNQDDSLTPGTSTRWVLLWQRDATGQWKVLSIQWVQWMGMKPSKGIWG